MSPLNAYFVALSPARRFDDALLKRTADLLRTDAYNARLLFAGELPRIIAEFPSLDEAASLASGLRELGLAAIAGANLDLQRTTSRVFIARSLEPGEKEVIFRGEVETRIIKRDDAFLILEGVCENPGTGRTGGKPEKKLNIPMTMLLGIPINQKVKPGAAVPSAHERFLRVYSGVSSEPVTEFRMGGVDYSFLGDKKGFSSTANFATLAGEMRRLFPGASFDNRLTRAFPYLTEQTLEPICRLIYRFYQDFPVARPAD